MNVGQGLTLSRQELTLKTLPMIVMIVSRLLIKYLYDMNST